MPMPGDGAGAAAFRAAASGGAPTPDPAPASGEHDPGPAVDAGPPRDPAQELRTLHEFLRLATTARTWDELLETVVDGTRDALQADVTSLYLLDRDGLNLTARGARTGSTATRSAARSCRSGRGSPAGWRRCARRWSSRTSRTTPASCGSAGIDQRASSHSMLSVPLTWHDQVVGVLNVQTEDAPRLHRRDVAQLSAIADLLAGIVEKGRLQAEAEAQVEQLSRARPGPQRADRARHPRAADAAGRRARVHGPARRGAAARRSRRRATPSGARPAPRGTRHARPDRAAGPARRLDPDVGARRPGPAAASSRPIDLAAMVERARWTTLAPLLAQPPHRRSCGRGGSTSWRIPARLRQVLEHLLENAVKYAPPGHAGRARTGGSSRASCGSTVADDGPGIPPEWRERIFEPYARRETSDGAGVRHRALRGTPAGGIDEGTTVVRAGAVGGCALRARAARRRSRSSADRKAGTAA